MHFFPGLKSFSVGVTRAALQRPRKSGRDVLRMGGAIADVFQDRSTGHFGHRGQIRIKIGAGAAESACLCWPGAWA